MWKNKLKWSTPPPLNLLSLESIRPQKRMRMNLLCHYREDSVPEKGRVLLFIYVNVRVGNLSTAEVVLASHLVSEINLVFQLAFLIGSNLISRIPIFFLFYFNCFRNLEEKGRIYYLFSLRPQHYLLISSTSIHKELNKYPINKQMDWYLKSLDEWTCK